jgi:ferric-dicitrate binding protein FerR (iron transport regulator)
MGVEDEDGTLLFALSPLQEWVARLVHYHAAQV